MDRIVILAWLLLVGSGASAQTSATADPAIEDLAIRGARAIEEAKLKKKPPQVLVWVCSEATGPISLFAVSFAREFSQSLLTALNQNPKFGAGAKVGRISIDEGLHPADLQSELIATRFATTRGYNVLVLGTCRARERDIEVQLKVLEPVSRRKLKTVSGNLASTPQRIAELAEPAKFHSANASIDTSTQIYRSGYDGTTVPACKYCPNPQFHEEARTVQGTVLLKIVVTMEGTAERISFVKRLNPYLDDAAVRAVRTWRFEPAVRNGQPVPVWTIIEINFRQVFGTTP